MAKSFFGSLITAAAKATDKAIKQAAQERVRQARIAEKERLRQEKQLHSLRNHTVMVNGVSYSRNLVDNPVTDRELAESKLRLEEIRAERKADDKKWSQCVSRNNKGKEYEKEGKIALAIKTYEKNIEGDCCPALHSFTRLMVLYRREKRLDDERRVLERALEVFSIDGDTRYSEYLEKWMARLLKIEILTKPQ